MIAKPHATPAAEDSAASSVAVAIGAAGTDHDVPTADVIDLLSSDVAAARARRANVHVAPVSTRWADADIAGNIRMALEARLGYLPETLDIKVIDSVVSLAGYLENGSQKTIVEETVDAMTGVRSVVNGIRIMPPSRLAMRSVHR